jgi:hypothetical protein
VTTKLKTSITSPSGQKRLWVTEVCNSDIWLTSIWSSWGRLPMRSLWRWLPLTMFWRNDDYLWQTPHLPVQLPHFQPFMSTFPLSLRRLLVILVATVESILSGVLQLFSFAMTKMMSLSLLGTMPEGRIRKEGLGLSSCAVPLTWVRAPNFWMKSRGHPTKFSWTLKVRQS